VEEKCLRNLSIKHEAQHKKVGVELNVKEIELKELEHKKAFCELQYVFLGEQHVALINKGNGLSMYPHPLCNLDA